MNRSQKSKCRKIAEKYGIANQEKQTISELAELNYVLTRRPSQRGESWEAEHKKPWIESLIDEMADNTIMIRQLQTLYSISDDDLNRMIDFKLERQLGRIERGDSGD